VLDAVAGEVAHAVVVHAHREVHRQRAARLQQARTELGLEVEQVGGALELRAGDAIELRAPLGARVHLRLIGDVDGIPAGTVPCALLQTHGS
jgi:hypothetical protein